MVKIRAAIISTRPVVPAGSWLHRQWILDCFANFSGVSHRERDRVVHSRSREPDDHMSYYCCFYSGGALNTPPYSCTRCSRYSVGGPNSTGPTNGVYPLPANQTDRNCASQRLCEASHSTFGCGGTWCEISVHDPPFQGYIPPTPAPTVSSTCATCLKKHLQ